MQITSLSKTIEKTVKNAKHVVVAIHQQPDADALGSLTAICEWLDEHSISHAGFCFGTSLGDCGFINEQRQLLCSHSELHKNPVDLIIVLDSGDLDYAGLQKVIPHLSLKPKIINIDHHATNNNFGHINIVNHNATSTTEILFHFFKALDFKITPRMACSLLAGIINDTYGFTNPNTTPECLHICSSLLKSGAKLPQVHNAILRNKTIQDLQTWGDVLTKLYHNDEYNISTTISTSRSTEGLPNFLNNLDNVNASLILTQEDEDTIKGSLRTNNDLIDVAKLATLLGGGGHRKAAGFKIKGKLIKAEKGWQVI